MRDFEDEVSGYLGNKKIIKLLEEIELESGEQNLSANLWRVYEVMVNAGFFKEKELIYLEAWLNDLSELCD